MSGCFDQRTELAHDVASGELSVDLLKPFIPELSADVVDAANFPGSGEVEGALKNATIIIHAYAPSR